MRALVQDGVRVRKKALLAQLVEPAEMLQRRRRFVWAAHGGIVSHGRGAANGGVVV